MEIKKASIEDEEIGYVLLDIIGGSRLKGTNNEDSDFDRYVIYLPTLDNYILKQDKIRNRNDLKNNINYIALNQFYISLMKGDFKTLEILNGYKENKHTYINPHFEEILNEISPKDYLNLNTFAHLLKILEETYEKYYTKSKSSKHMGTIYEMLFEMLNLIDSGKIKMPLRENKLIYDIKYNQEFFNERKNQLEEKVLNSINIYKEAVKNNEQVLLEKFPKLTDEEIDEKLNILNSTIIYLVKKFI